MTQSTLVEQQQPPQQNQGISMKKIKKPPASQFVPGYVKKEE